MPLLSLYPDKALINKLGTHDNTNIAFALSNMHVIESMYSDLLAELVSYYLQANPLQVSGYVSEMLKMRKFKDQAVKVLKASTKSPAYP